MPKTEPKPQDLTFETQRETCPICRAGKVQGPLPPGVVARLRRLAAEIETQAGRRLMPEELEKRLRRRAHAGLDPRWIRYHGVMPERWIPLREYYRLVEAEGGDVAARARVQRLLKEQGLDVDW